jgi:hypothetical protein
MNAKLESFVKFLIDRGLIDNEDEETETIHKFLQLYEAFEVETSNNASPDDSDRIDPFETRVVFTLADFIKSLGPNEYYDIS